MEIQGKVIQVLAPASGTSKSGNAWKKQEYVIETHDQYPRKVMFMLFGDRADQYKAEVGQEVIVSFDLESREFNGRWYTDVRAWKMEAAPLDAYGNPVAPAAAAPAAPAAAPVTPPAVPQFPDAAPEPSPTDDLPF